jgi:hypothetical protein
LKIKGLLAPILAGNFPRVKSKFFYFVDKNFLTFQTLLGIRGHQEGNGPCDKGNLNGQKEVFSDD